MRYQLQEETHKTSTSTFVTIIEQDGIKHLKAAFAKSPKVEVDDGGSLIILRGPGPGSSAAHILIRLPTALQVPSYRPSSFADGNIDRTEGSY